MKNNARSFPRLASVLFLTLTLLCAFAYFAPANSLRAVAAQSTSPSGSFGFVGGVSQIDSNGSNGGALLGVMNFDGAGNVTGTGTLKPRDTNNQNAQAVPTTFTGTYSSNPDGTGSLTLNFDVGFSATFAVVTTDGGQGFQFVETDCTPCGADAPLQGQALSLSGGLPIALFLQGATGNIPLSLTGVNSAGGGAIVYTAAAATGSGTAQCPDGSKGTWTASVPTLTVALNGGGSVHGNFFAAVFGTICGQADFETLSGLVTGTISPSGATSLVLHGTGSVFSGVARAAQAGGSLNGAYGLLLNFQPFPAGAVGVMKFDGAGNVAVSLTAVGGGSSTPGTSTLSGTYSINPDGSGTINLKAPSGQPGPAYSFVITDGGSQLLLLRTDANPVFDVAFGTARLQ
jgi:hypothetical protein